MTTKEVRRRFSITLSATSGKAFDWLKAKTDADTDSEVIRNALRLHYVLLQHAESGGEVIARSDKGDTAIAIFVVK